MSGKTIRIKRARDHRATGELRDVAARARELAGPTLSEDDQKALDELRAREQRESEIIAALDEMADVNRTVVRVAHERDQAKAHVGIAKRLQAHALELIEKADLPNGSKIQATDPWDGSEVTGSYVKPAPGQVLDADKLKESISEEAWDAITKRVVDQDLLEAALVRGDVTKEQVNEAMEEGKPRSPHIRISRRGGTKT